MTSERWLPVVGFEGMYEVSDLGRVRGLDRAVPRSDGRTMRLPGRLLNPMVANTGYITAGLPGGPRLIHRLVLEAFVGPAPEGHEACHNNGDRTDARLSNLRWGTHSENLRDAVLHGTHNHARKTHCKRDHPFSPENTRTYTRPDGSQVRVCRTCTQAASRRYKRRRRELRAA